MVTTHLNPHGLSMELLLLLIVVSNKGWLNFIFFKKNIIFIFLNHFGILMLKKILKIKKILF
jgi:hypothetical protein